MHGKGTVMGTLNTAWTSIEPSNCRCLSWYKKEIKEPCPTAAAGTAGRKSHSVKVNVQAWVEEGQQCV